MEIGNPRLNSREPAAGAGILLAGRRFALPGAGLRSIALGAGVFILFTLALALVQWGTDALVGTDGYYHARMGALIRDQGLKPDFIWLPLTILDPASFYDHHLLYHLYLALFAWSDPIQDGGWALTRAMKLASIIMPALAFTAGWWLLRSRRIRWPFLWSLGFLAVSEAFLYRMNMPRAQSASLLVLILGIHWLLDGRYRRLLPLGFVYVWLYDGFPLLLAAAGIYMVVLLALERRIEPRVVLFPAAGMALGLIINPYFPENLVFIFQHLAPKVVQPDTRVGNEWYPYETWTLVENSGFALGAFLAGALAWGWRKERMDRGALMFFLLAVSFGLLLFRSRRFVEYFPAMALLFAALSVGPLLSQWATDSRLKDRLSAVAMLAVLAPMMWITLGDARSATGRSKAADHYAQAGLWLRQHADPGAFVFQTDWDDFPRLFFYNPDSIYTVGLDPTYLQLKDEKRYEEWKEITQGKVESPGEIIAGEYGASYVFSDLKHGRFLDQAAGDPFLKEVYRDEYAVILTVERPALTLP